MKAIIPAAGLGTRFLPETKSIPKEMLPVLDKPVIQYVVEEGLASGADEVVIVNNHSKPEIERHFSPSPELIKHLRSKGKDAYADAVTHAGKLPVSFTYQEEQKGLGHAVLCAKDVVESEPDEPFCILLGDVIVPDNGMLPKMVEISNEHDGASVIAVMPVTHDDVSRFGVIAGNDLGDGVWKVTGMVEKPPVNEAPSDLVIFGRYLLSPRVMGILSHTNPGAGGEIQLTDAMVELLNQEEMYALVIDPSDGLDTGTIDSWLDANIEMRRRRNANGR